MILVGEDLIGDLVPIYCHGQGHLPPDHAAQGPSNLASSMSRDGTSTASLSKLLQYLTVI